MDSNIPAGQSFYAPDESAGPPLPPRGAIQPTGDGNLLQPPQYERPPQRKSIELGEDSHSPIHYMRDPHKLVAYLVPFPKPTIGKKKEGTDAPAEIPDRFMIYTPPAPPLLAPKEGEKEDKLRKVQRKWQEEVRDAKASDAKVTSWKGVKSRATKGINSAMSWTTTSGLDFLNRVPTHNAPKDKAAARPTSASPEPENDDDLYNEPTTKKTVGLEEMVLIYPASMPGDEQTIRAEFVSTMLRSKSAAQRDAIIATGLLPVSAAIDILATVVWPFGGLLEIDSVWAYSSIMGAKTARSVTKRLHSSAPGDDPGGEHKIHLAFSPSPRLDVLQRFLAAECHTRDPWTFASFGVAPTESEVLEAIGWSPSQTGGETRNWEDEQWEVQEVKTDLRGTMKKGAKEWAKWCQVYEKNPEKALKK